MGVRQVPKQDKIVIRGSGLNIIFVIFAPSSSSSTSCPRCHLWLNYRVPCRAEILQIYSDLPNLFIFRLRALIRCLFNLCEILFNPCNANIRAELKSVSSVQSVVKKRFTVLELYQCNPSESVVTEIFLNTNHSNDTNVCSPLTFLFYN